jgi:hypothetical protein
VRSRPSDRKHEEFGLSFAAPAQAPALGPDYPATLLPTYHLVRRLTTCPWSLLSGGRTISRKVRGRWEREKGVTLAAIAPRRQGVVSRDGSRRDAASCHLTRS